MTATNSDRFEDRLLAQLRPVVAERPAPVVRRGRVGRRATRVVAIGATCLAFAGTAMAASGIWAPSIGVDGASRPPSISATPTPTALTEALGVLRREPTDRDRSAEVEATLRGVAFADGVRPDSARYLAPGLPGEATVLLSAEAASPFFTEEEPVCVYRPLEGWGTDEPVGTCFGLAQILSDQARMTALPDGNRRGLVLGLVPDGVATVTAEFGSAPDRTVPVTNNYFELWVNGAELSNANGESSVQHTVWRDANGEVVPQRDAD